MATRVAAACAAAVLLALSACGTDSPPTDPPPTGTPPSSPAPAQAQAVTLVGAGDIASCAHTADTGTADLLDDIPGEVFTLGDNAYNNGTPEEFARCYGPTWGRHRDRTHPVIGNHEYHTDGAQGYFDYFGRSAGRPGEGWYSYAAGAWHVVVLNSNCDVVPGGCAAGSAQERWLRADLAAHRTRCAVAMWHHPLFTSSAVHPPTASTLPLFRALHDSGVDVLLTGHNHQYERFAPQDPRGARDDRRGIREFVVGTGGDTKYGFGTPTPHSEKRLAGTPGVLRLDLTADAYEWRFVPVSGGEGDAGRGTCH
ncbi:metallophosphoesterase [Asanoa sp. WMMD1127]|uniref:metallophosphoesterase family protein n=1 Tax=Asanoa sp. WMMD1127 TaxID=3016107 RepID=UPI002415B331|nr:metallophosphoesterase [Asanoa sp. WMMD1127]MDG4826168.1 metallophosphoesterase [Asanoa sp. WMMD1127]